MQRHCFTPLTSILFIAACGNSIPVGSTGYDGPTGEFTGEFTSFASNYGEDGSVSSDVCEGTVGVLIDKFGEVTGESECLFRNDGFNTLFCATEEPGVYLCTSQLVGHFISEGEEHALVGTDAAGDGNAIASYSGSIQVINGVSQLHASSIQSLVLQDQSTESLFVSGFYFEVPLE